jgi:hypothetical protein
MRDRLDKPVTADSLGSCSNLDQVRRHQVDKPSGNLRAGWAPAVLEGFNNSKGARHTSDSALPGERARKGHYILDLSRNIKTSSVT